MWSTNDFSESGYYAVSVNDMYVSYKYKNKCTDLPQLQFYYMHKWDRPYVYSWLQS